MKPGLTVKGKGLEEVRDSIRKLAEQEVLVGFPAETTERDKAEQDDEGITNAALGYIHDNGMPEQNIPARPFMAPGIARANDAITRGLFGAARRTLMGVPGAAEAGLHTVGLKAKLAIQNAINEGVPPPLADSTLRRRAAKGRKGAILELENRAKGGTPSTTLAKPLIDSGQLRNAVNYVIRSRKKRG